MIGDLAGGVKDSGSGDFSTTLLCFTGCCSTVEETRGSKLCVILGAGR